jgi:hypothetical protein
LNFLNKSIATGNKFRKSIAIWNFCLLTILLANHAGLANATPAFIENSTLTGNIRSYFQTKDFDTQADVSAYTLGGKLKLETGSFKGWEAGTAFYWANDFDINRDDLALQNGLLPSSLSTFGEAYLQYDSGANLARFGRQKIDTPFMNPSDAFIAPVTFFGYSLKNTSFKHFEFSAMHVTEVKVRQVNTFEDTGQFLTKRLGVTPTNTTGTTVFGVQWENDDIKLEGWEYHLPDLFNMVFFQANMDFEEISGMKPFLSIQAGHQFDVGNNLLGNVNASAFGINFGTIMGGTKLAYAFNYLPKNPGNFRNGAFLSPYSFATDALYTNSLDGGLTLKDSAFVGGAHKWTANFEFNETIWSELSYTYFDLIKSVGGKDSREINVDVIYKFQGSLKGLSLRNRLALVESDRVAENLIENRLQAQYVFDNLL